MIFNRRPKRKAPTTELVKPKTMENPLYQTEQPGLPAFRRRILSWAAGTVALILVGLAVYGPWLRIETIDVRGTRLLDPDSVKQVTEHYLDRQRWLIIPNRNLWLFSRSHASMFLRARIEERLAIDEITVTKHYPHHLQVQVSERIPAFIWQSNNQRATVDRQGVVIELLAPDAPSANIPLVLDGPGRTLSVNLRLIVPEALTAMQTLAELMAARQWEIEHFVIPTPICPTLPEPEPEPTTSNTNQPIQNTNSISANTNQTVGNQNVNQLLTLRPCDLAVLTKQSIEIHAKLKDGPVIYFDRHQNLAQAVATVDRVLLDPANRQARYIDVRFGERVYIQ